jgi:ATP-dependent Clp protease ATP-binding subunit ClpB
MESLRGHFRPEFLNRIDEIVIFDRLSDRDITKIIDIQLERLMHRLEKQKLSLQLSEKAKVYLAKEGYDPAYGARPLKRVIQQKILDPLSMEILDGKIKEGDSMEGDLVKGELVFKKI